MLNILKRVFMVSALQSCNVGAGEYWWRRGNYGQSRRQEGVLVRGCAITCKTCHTFSSRKSPLQHKNTYIKNHKNNQLSLSLFRDRDYSFEGVLVWIWIRGECDGRNEIKRIIIWEYLVFGKFHPILKQKLKRSIIKSGK
jgi:hypothetical protein